jgi:ATP-dependent RNA helicase DDX60
MGQDLLQALESAEENWRKSSPEWNQKLRGWEIWKLHAKERERLLERVHKQKKDPNEPEVASIHDSSWEKSFNPDDPSPQFSFAGTHTSYSKTELDEDIANLAWASIQPWAVACLRRGIAVHHAGMNKRYRSLVERWVLSSRLLCRCPPLTIYHIVQPIPARLRSRGHSHRYLA